MRPYEVMYILQPTLSADEQTALVDRFTELVTSMGGTIDNVDRWERRRLAYEIKRFQDGYYVVMTFHGDVALEAEMARQMKLTEPILRHMILRRDEPDEVAAVVVEEAAVVAEEVEE